MRPVGIDYGTDILSGSREDDFRSQTSESPYLRSVYGQFPGCIVKAQPFSGCMHRIHILFQSRSVITQIGVVDERIEILLMMYGDDIGTYLICVLQIIVRFVFVGILIKPFLEERLSSQSLERSDEQFKIKVQTFAFSELSFSGVSLNHGIVFLRLYAASSLRIIAPGLRQIQLSVRVVNIDQLFLIVLIL